MAIIDNDGWSFPGARWWKFDFHTHTPASIDYGKGPQSASLRQTTPADWLLDFMRSGVDCVAVTDHNSGEWIDDLRSALSKLEQEQHPDFRPLHLFPGIEVTANGGTHVLALFDPKASSDTVERLLGAIRYRGEHGKSDIAAEASVIQIVEEVDKAGGIAVPAHADEEDGAWELTGNTLSPLLDSPGLFAVEIKDPQSQPHPLYVHRKIGWAEVLGSDSHHPASSNQARYPGSHFTWVKMSTPSIEGLRLALLDGGGFSLRRSDEIDPFDPHAIPKNRIQTIELVNARYMGNGIPARLEFGPWLNALIGGRGTGKSTVVHGLRLVAQRKEEMNDLDERSTPRQTFERFNKVPPNRNAEGGLRADTEIICTFMRDEVLHRLLWRQDGTGVPVQEQSRDGTWTDSASQAISGERFGMKIFSQGQIAEMAGENQLPLLQAIDEAAGVADLKENMELARSAFYATKAQIRDLDNKLVREETLSVQRQDVDRKLQRFEGNDHAAILTTRRHHGQQQTEVDKRFASLEGCAERIEETADELQLENWPDGLLDENLEEDQDVIKAFADLKENVRSAAQELRQVAQRLRERTDIKREELANSKWRLSVESSSTSYTELLQKLQEEGISDLEEYDPLVKQRRRLDGEQSALEAEKVEKDKLVIRAKQELVAVANARRAISEARVEFLSKNLSQNQFVRIALRQYGDDPRMIERSLREALGVPDDRFQDDILQYGVNGPQKGIVAFLLSDLPETPTDRIAKMETRLNNLKSQLASACLGQGDFGGHFNNYLVRQHGLNLGLVDQLDTWFPEDALDVRYNRSGDGEDFQPITQASAGQRAAAMLAFLLAHGEEPLVLDQPEDDLDNQLIYDLVVQQIRESKLRRQIIVVTHNPNIVVNGDAEMLQVLEFGQGQCFVAQSGSMQEKPMRDKVCEVLEGGREAFERRYRRLGSEISSVG